MEIKAVIEMIIEAKENRFRKITGKGRGYLCVFILGIMIINFTACSSGAEDQMTSEPEMSDETISAPETYEDYMELAEKSYYRQDWETALTYYQGAKELDDSREEAYRGMSDACLQMDDVEQALAILDEGVARHDIDSSGQNASGQNSLSQRKEYVLAGMVEIRTKFIENEYDGDGSILFERVSESDENGNIMLDQSVYYDEQGEINYLSEYQYDENGNQTEYKYIYYDSDGTSSIPAHVTWAYDTNGNETEWVTYDKDGNIEERTENWYDANGNQIKETNYDKDGFRKRWVEIAYDDAGNEIEWNCHYEYGRHTIKRIHIYDEWGKLIGYVRYRNEKIIEKEEYERDENGNIIKSVNYDGDGNIAKIYEYEYDKMGREIKLVCYNGDGTVNFSFESEYDGNGNEIKTVCYDGGGQTGWISEYEYDESGREICYSHENNGVVTELQENEYGEDGSIIREVQTYYDSDTGEKTYERACEYTYDEKGNMIKYDFINYDEKETKSLRWEKEYDEEGRGTGFYLYDNEKTASYQGKTEYDETGLLIKYTGYDKNGNVLVRRETEYNASGKAIKENYYDKDGSLIRYYENEYDDFGNVTRQTMYEDGSLKSEKQISYAYHYIGNIDAEATDYIDNDITTEEYNRKQREIFIRFLNGEEKVRYNGDGDNDQNGKIVEETITDLIDFEYIREYKRTLEYTFLDMTGDGIEELVIFYSGDPERLCVIQCSYGALKVIYDIDGRFNAYLIKYNGRTGICHDYGTQNGEDRNYYYFLDGKGKKEIALDEYMDWTESYFYSASDSDSFEERDISKGEYYDIMSGMVEMMDIDWQELEVPAC